MPFFTLPQATNWHGRTFSVDDQNEAIKKHSLAPLLFEMATVLHDWEVMLLAKMEQGRLLGSIMSIRNHCWHKCPWMPNMKLGYGLVFCN